ncbi:MAG: methyltransferase family protein [Candidatus Thorarchaeota archaeon]|jgi:protein-S-isoprenylcysteine O-methyltransferase Ste14
MIEYIIIFLASTLFGLQHSGLSALRVKSRIIDRWGKEGYARIFNATSILTLLIAFLSMNFWDWIYFITQPALIQPVFLILGVISGLTGVVLAMKASSVIDVSTVADMRTDRKAELITDGIYSRIRHPLYLATILVFSALALVYPFPVVIVFSLSLIGYTMIGAYFEERKLLKHYGDDYIEYKKTAGFILPRVG